MTRSSFSFDGGRLARLVQLNTHLLSWLDHAGMRRLAPAHAVGEFRTGLDLKNEGRVIGSISDRALIEGRWSDAPRLWRLNINLIERTSLASDVDGSSLSQSIYLVGKYVTRHVYDDHGENNE
jgi:hypothetical protein